MAATDDLGGLLEQLRSAIRSDPTCDRDPAASEIEWMVEEDPEGCREIVLNYQGDQEIQLWALGLAANRDDLDLFLDALGNPRLRKVALAAMASQQDITRVDQAARGLLADPDPEIRSLAIDLISARPQPGAMDALLSVANDPEPNVRMNVCLRLGRLGDPRAVERLTAMLADAHPGVRDTASQSLALLRDALS